MAILAEYNIESNVFRFVFGLRNAPPPPKKFGRENDYFSAFLCLIMTLNYKAMCDYSLGFSILQSFA
ncbi:hypothetical protein [Helicobacter typhlonius]|uniref:hypothetical protein n=1 Tax=Helicobacter typhlonius TaxID=76936 RepID=UPI002FE2B626